MCPARACAIPVSAVQIVILVLSQDEALAKMIHKLTVPSVPWYKERNLSNTSLGSFTFIVLLRAAHRNLLGAKDVYAHSNCLAALSNLAPHAVHLSPHAASRLLLLVATGHRRLRWLAGERVRACAVVMTCPVSHHSRSIRCCLASNLAVVCHSALRSDAA